MTTQNHSEWPPERIAEVLEYCGKATPGPFAVQQWINPDALVVRVPGTGVGSAIAEFGPLGRDDAEFYARARADLPSAVREIQRLSAALRNSDAHINATQSQQSDTRSLEEKIRDGVEFIMDTTIGGE